MIRKKIFRRVLFLILILLAIIAFSFTQVSTKRHTITYDHDCFIIDGKDQLIYSGSLHYFRCPKDLWKDRLLKIKRAGFNTIEFYAPWNYHEESEGKVDMSELDDFLTLCEKMKFYIIARVGPFICGEHDNGGFPAYLIKKGISSASLRTNQKEYVKYVKHWYNQVLPVVKKHLITRGGGVILLQVENEYGGGAYYKREVIRDRYKMARQHGIDVPIVTCNTPCAWDNDDAIMSDIINGNNSWVVRWENISRMKEIVSETRENEFNAPTIVLEMPGGGGVFSNFVGRDIKEIRPGDYDVATKTAWLEGAGLTNFYMLYGGTNFGYNAASWISTSYWNRHPVRCPLLEPGGIWERYYRVKLLGQWIKEFGPSQVRSETLPNAAYITMGGGKKPPNIMEKVNGEQAFIFVREEEDAKKEIRFSYTDPKTNQKLTIPQKGYLTLPARDMQILLANVKLSNILLKYSTSQILNIGKVGNRRVLVLYGVEGSDGEAVFECETMPQVEGTGDYSWDKENKLLRVNYQYGKIDSHILIDNVELVIVNKERAYRSWDLELNQDTLTLVSDAYFLREYSENGESFNLMIETFPGNSHYSLILPREPDKLVLNGQDLPFEWNDTFQTVSFDLNTPRLPQTIINFREARFKKEELARGDWKSVELKSLEDLDILDKGYVRYKTSFNADKANSMIIRFYEGSAKSESIIQTTGDPTMVFINNKYIPEASGWRGRKIKFDLSKYIEEGENTIEVILEKIGRPNLDRWRMGEPKGLAAVSLLNEEGEKPMMKAIGGWKIKYGLYGQNEGYYKTDFNHELWEEVSLGNWKKMVDGAEGFDGIGWYRLDFNLDLPEGWNIPLKLHMEAETDAIIYLNGILVGRYFNIGWQKDFYLPECWMNLNGRNVIAVAVRNSGKEGGLLEASILPYQEFSVKKNNLIIEY